MEPWISRITFSSVVIRNYLQKRIWPRNLDGKLSSKVVCDAMQNRCNRLPLCRSFPSSLADLLAWINCVAWECMHVCNRPVAGWRPLLPRGKHN